MDDLVQSFRTWDSVTLMWLAGGLAVIFVSVILFDSIRSQRKHSRRAKSLERRAKLSREGGWPATQTTPIKPDGEKPATE